MRTLRGASERDGAVTWLATLLAVVGIAAATYVAVTAHWRCDRIERQLATDRHPSAASRGRHRGEK